MKTIENEQEPKVYTNFDEANHEIKKLREKNYFTNFLLRSVCLGSIGIAILMGNCIVDKNNQIKRLASQLETQLSQAETNLLDCQENPLIEYKEEQIPGGSDKLKYIYINGIKSLSILSPRHFVAKGGHLILNERTNVMMDQHTELPNYFPICPRR